MAEQLHFTHAARLLHIAQPALSQSIRQLEEEIGAQLITRSTRRVELTEAGRAFYEHARRTLQTLERGIASTLRIARESKKLLVFGFTSAGMYGRLPDLIRQFRTRVNDAQLMFREYTADALLTALRDSAVDIAVLHGYCSDPVLSGVTLDRELCVLAVPSRHRLASARRGIALKQLADEAILVPPQTAFYGLYEAVTAACIRAGLSPHVNTQAPGAQALIGLAAAEIGIAIVPDSIATRREGIVYRKILGDPIEVELRMYWQKYEQSSETKQFLHVVERARKVKR